MIQKQGHMQLRILRGVAGMRGGVYRGKRVCGGRTRWSPLPEERRDVRRIGGAVAGLAGYECGEAGMRGGVYRGERVCGGRTRWRRLPEERGDVRRIGHVASINCAISRPAT